MKWFIALLFFSIIWCDVQAQYNFESVDKILQDSLTTIAGDGGGAALLLIKDGKVIYSKSFNLDGKNFSTETIVPIASATKWISAGVIMALIDQGYLTLDTKLSKYFQAIESPKSEITLRQLFSHTSGIKGNNDGSLDIDCQKGTNVPLDECARQILDNELIATPGTAFNYGGNSMQVAGRLAELATGIKMQSGFLWQSLFEQLIKTPLGMKLTRYTLVPDSYVNNPRIGGGIYSNAEEYAKFLSMILNKGTYDNKIIIKPGSIIEMLKDQMNGASIGYSPYGSLQQLLGIKYGIGNWVEARDPKTNNPIESSSQGAFGFSPWIDQNRNMVGVLSVYSELKSVMPTYFKLKKSIKEQIDKQTNIKETNVNVYKLAISPNPVTSNATISFQLNQSGDVTLKIYNLLGYEVATLINQNLNDGEHKFDFDFSNYPPSLYIYKFKHNNYLESNKFYVYK